MAKSKPLANTEINDQVIIQTVNNYRYEAEQARRTRMDQNRINFDVYHMRTDNKGKIPGQSNEFLPRMSMAVEQGANFIQQGLIDIGDWFRVEAEAGLNTDALLIKPEEIRLILKRQLENIMFHNKIGDAAKLGFIGSLMIFKVHGKRVPKPEYVARTEVKGDTLNRQLIKIHNKAWELSIELIRQEDYLPDPSGLGLYEMQDSWIDAYALRQLAEGDNAIYDKAIVEKCIAAGASEKPGDANKRAHETGQNVANAGYRKQVKLTEVWGNILGPNGELLHENIVTTIANDQYVIRKPTKNPYWHGDSPFIAIPILSVPHSVWHKAVMDSATHLNLAINEMFNLMVDGGMMAVHGIKQVREDWLDDVNQVAEGITAGTTLKANSSTPPGQHVLERIDTSSVPADGFNMLNVLSQEFNASAFTNDLRMGVQSFRAVKATEVVEASQSLTSMFTGMVKNIETGLDKVLDKSWKVIAQHMDDMDSAAMTALLGVKRQKVIAAMSREEIFAETVNGTRFKTFGISETLNKQRDFTKLQAFLQTVASSEVMLESFLSRGYSFGKLLEEIMKALDINVAKLKEEEAGEPPPEVALPPQPGPNLQSQIPQAGAASNQADLGPSGPIPQTKFPGSPATVGQGAQ